MFRIRLANLVIGMENKYEYVHWLCRDYETDVGTPDFCVSATEQEIAKEQKGSAEDGGGRKIFAPVLREHLPVPRHLPEVGGI